MYSLDEEKKIIRKVAKTDRYFAMKKFKTNEKRIFFERLRSVLFNLSEASVVSSFLAIGDEINMMPIMEAITSTGRACVLPAITGEGQPLIFREWTPDGKLLKGPFNTRHPDFESEEMTPDVLLIPFLAFDKLGYRLGWGGGFYDRTISHIQGLNKGVTAIGVGLQAQEIDNLPRGKFDKRLDLIVTEQNIFTFSKKLGMSY